MLRPYSGEILYSWLARTAAIYDISLSELLGFPATPWDLLAATAPDILHELATLTRMPIATLESLTIASTGVPKQWWNIRQVTPDNFSPSMEYSYQPVVAFCRLCLWNDFITDGNEYLRLNWMAALPTICPTHLVAMEDRCSVCWSCHPPVSVKTGRGFRFLCSSCAHPVASPKITDKAACYKRASLLENMILRGFETAFSDALKSKWNLRFPGSPTHFLQMIEDLFWLLTRRMEGVEQLFVHHLNRTVFRIPLKLHYLPQARPWMGDFDIHRRRGLISHIAALSGGNAVREQLTVDPAPPYAVPNALRRLQNFDREELRRRLESWPKLQQGTVFSEGCTN